MAKSRDHVEYFLEEFREHITAYVTSPGATAEALISQQHMPIPEDVTPEEQKRVLFHTVQEVTSQSKDSLNQILTHEEHELSTDLEQSQQNSSNIKQLEDKSTQVNMTTNWETIQRQRPLPYQLMEEIEQHWERERNKIRYLKTKTEQQQKDIDRLTAEKHDQYLVIKALRVKVEDVIEKNEATQEKMQHLKLQAEIYQERETLDRRRNEIINKQCKFEMIKYDESKKYSKEVQEIMDSLLSAMNLNKKIIITAKQAKEQTEKNLEDVKEELERNKKYISQHRDQIEHIKHSLSININKVKQRWIEFQRDTEIQNVTVTKTERREGQEEGTDTFESVKEKLSRIRQEMEKVWDVLVDSKQLEVTVRDKQEVHTQSIQMENMKSNSQKLRQDPDTHMRVTHCETVIKTDMQRQKQDIDNKLAQIQWERHEIERINTRIQAERENIEREKHLAKAEMDALRSMRESNEKQRQELDDKLQRTKKEIRELEALNSEIEIKKKDLVRMIRMSRRKKQISKMKKETEHATQDLEDRKNVMVGHRSEQGLEVNIENTLKESITKLQQVDVIKHKGNQVEEDNKEMSTKNKENGMQRMIFEVQETKMLCLMREDTERRKRNFTEEIKWRNFEEKKKKKKMEQLLEKIIKERDELEIIKLQIQRQREEVERKLQDTITTILAMGEMKAYIEKAVTEINNMQQEMLKTHRQMEEDKEDVRKYMDKLSSLKTCVSRWILAESAIKKTFSTNSSKLPEPHKKSRGDSLQDQTLEISPDEERDAGEITQGTMSLQQSPTLEDQHQNEEIKQGQFFSLDIFIQTEKHEETLTDDEFSEYLMNVRQMEEAERQMCKFKEREERIKEQIQNAMENMEKKNQEIERLIMDIYEPQSQRPEIGLTMTFRKSVQEATDESDFMILDIEKQKQNQESKTDPLTHNGGKDGGSEIHLKEEMSDMKSVKTAAKKQKRELDQLQEKTLREREKLDLLKIKMQKQTDVISEKMKKMVKVKNIVEKSTVNIRIKNEDIKINIKETEVNLRKLEALNYKFEATKHNLESSYLLISQQRAELEKCINKIKQKTDGEYALENTEKKFNSAETNTERDKLTKIRMRKEMEEMEILGLQSDKEKPETDVTLTMNSMDQRNSGTEEFQNSISEEEMQRLQIQVELGEIEIHEINCLRESIKRQTQELEDRAQIAKREIREMELLKSEVEIKRKECEQMLRKSMRKKEESENLLNKLQREKELLRRETSKKRRELDQRLEKTMRERDELEVLRIKLQQQKEELAVEKQVRSNKEKAEMIHQASEVIDPQTMRQKINLLLDKVKGILENVNVNLVKQREGLKALQGENRTIRDNMVKVKSQIKLAFKKLAVQVETEMNQIVQMKDDVQKQKYDLDVGLQNVKRERREMEVLNTELDITKRENQQMIRKGIRKDQEVRKMWAEVKEEKDILKREVRRRKKELDQQLERIIRERDELEIMKMQRGKDDSKSVAEQLKASCTTNAENNSQRHWELINICMERCKHMKKDSEGLHEAIKNGNQQIKVQAEIIIQAKEEVEITRKEIKRQKDMMMCLLKGIQQKQRNLEQVEVHFSEEIKAIEKDKEEGAEKSEEFVLIETKFLKLQRSILKVEQQKQDKTQRQMKRLLYITDSEKELEIPETKRKMVQTQTDQSKEKKEEAHCGKNQKTEEQMTSEIKEEIPSDEQQRTFVLNMNKPLQMDIKKENILKEERFTELEGLKENMDCYTELLGRDKEGLIKILSDIIVQKEDFENLRKEKFWTEKLHLDKLKTEMNDEREDLERMNEMMNNYKVDLELMRSDIQKQSDLLQQGESYLKDERENLEMTKTQLEKKIKHADNLFEDINRENSTIKDLALQVHAQRNILQNVMDVIAVKKKEQDVKDDDIRRQIQELQTQKNSVLVEREELGVLRMDLNKKYREVEAAMNTISEEKEDFIQMKADIAKEREMLLIEKERMEGQWSDLKMRENKHMDKMKLIECLRIRLQELDGRRSQDMNNKIIRLEQNKEDIVKLVSILEEKHAALDVHKANLMCYTEMLETEREELKSVWSGVVTQRQDMENQLKPEILLGKTDLLKLKAELDQKTEDLGRLTEMIDREKLVLALMRSENQKQCDLLQQAKEDMKEEKEKLKITKTELQKKKEHVNSLFDEINREKTNIKDLSLQLQTQRNKLENVIDRVTLKEKEQELHDDAIRRLKQELETREKSVLTETQELEVWRKNINKTKEEAEVTMNSISGEREHLSQIKTDIVRERAMFLNEKDKLEKERSELIIREHEVISKMRVIETVKVKLQQLYERISDEIKVKMESLQQNNGAVLLLYTALEERFTELEGLKENMDCYTELLGRDKEGLIKILSDIIVQKEDFENLRKEKFWTEKLHLDKLKTEMNDEREDLERMNEMMNNYKVDLELMRSDIQKQSDLLQQGEGYLKDERENLEMTKTQLEKKIKHADNLFEDINRENSTIKDLALQVHAQRNILQNVMDVIAVKKKEQDVKDDDIRRQIQELQTQKNSVLVEREELGVLRMDLNKKYREVEAAMNTISEEKEDFIQMKADIAKEREMLLIEKERMEGQWSDLKMRENKHMDKMKLIECLRIRLQELDGRRSQDMNNKIIRLEQNKEDIVKLVSILEEKHAALDVHKANLMCYTEMLETEREELKSVWSGVVTQRQDMENQLKPEILLGKTDLLKLKAELDQKTEDLGRLTEMIDREKLVLNLMRSEIDNHKNTMTGYSDLIQNEKKHVVTVNFDKAVQTVSLPKESLQGHDIKKQDLNKHKDFEYDSLLESDVIHTKVQHQRKFEGDLERESKQLETKRKCLLIVTKEMENYQKQKPATLSKMAAEQNYFTVEKMSKRDCLQKIWKSTKIDRKEIDNMKSRGHGIRINLEKRLQVINQFVKRTCLQKERELQGKTKLGQRLGKNTTSERERERDCKILDEKYVELQQLKVQMLSEIEKLHIKETEFRTLMTCDKANQTLQVDITMGNEAMQTMQQDSTKKHQEQMVQIQATSETSSGLLSQLQHYCCRCCCPCCARCTQGTQ